MANISENIYRIQVQGTVHERWRKWFAPLSIIPLENGDTLLSGSIQDQSQLIGIINQIHNLNLKLISVNCGGSAFAQNLGGMGH